MSFLLSNPADRSSYARTWNMRDKRETCEADMHNALALRFKIRACELPRDEDELEADEETQYCQQADVGPQLTTEPSL